MKKFKKTITLLFFFFFVLFVGYLVFSFLNQQKVPQEQTERNSYRGLVPGTSTESEVIKKLGSPKEKIEGPEEIQLRYSTKSSTRDNFVLLKEGRVYLIREVYTAQDNQNINSYKNLLGEPALVLYGPEATANVYLFAYPETGLSFLANNEKGLVFEVWYFSPTTKENFIKNIASNYDESPEEAQ